MKLTLQEIIELNFELNGMSFMKDGEQKPVTKGLLNQKTSLKTKLYIQRLAKIVKEEVELFENAKKSLFERLGEKKDEELIIPKEKVEEFNKEYNDLLKAEKEIVVSTLWTSDFTPNDLASIETEENYPVFLRFFEI